MSSTTPAQIFIPHVDLYELTLKDPLFQHVFAHVKTTGEDTFNMWWNRMLPDWLEQFKAVLVSLGFPEANAQYYTVNDKSFLMEVYGASKGEFPGRVIHLPAAFNQPCYTQTQYTGTELHPKVLTYLNINVIYFIITKGEEWWPGPKAFFTDHINNAVLWGMYEGAIQCGHNHKKRMEILNFGKPKVVEPRDHTKGHSPAYTAWLAECAAFNEDKVVRVNALLEEIEVLRKQIAEVRKEKGPKWQKQK
jgi:hypothetical protein